MEALGINLGYLLVQILAFIVLYSFLSRWIYGPLSRALNERRTRIAKGLEDAAAAAKARQNAEAEAEQILAQARAQAAKVIEEAEWVLFQRAFELSGGNQSKAARWLGVARQTVREKWQQFGLRSPDPDAERTEDHGA